MTHDQLELVMAREGLTRPQREAVLAAAEAYATAQCKAALDALSFVLAVPPGMHWQVLGEWAGPACAPSSGKPCTTDRARVTCGACRQNTRVEEGSMSTCTCSPCGREFTTLAAFDRHQDIDYTRRPPVLCRDPATVGLEQNALGRWHFPADARSRARLAKIRAEKASAHTSVTPPASGASQALTEPQPEGQP